MLFLLDLHCNWRIYSVITLKGKFWGRNANCSTDKILMETILERLYGKIAELMIFFFCGHLLPN